ncbi:MAG: sulfatase-like hydrolase/transferase [Pirellulaceae bacterium]|nr:sulfatase-like hydrolase/transferase [Pirellulaceae bacterium]
MSTVRLPPWRKLLVCDRKNASWKPTPLSYRWLPLHVIALCVAMGMSQASAAMKPDVLVILTDQWNPRYLSWDNAQVRTPNIDRIASEGMIFDACYTTSPICMPARISLITGLYPHNAGHSVWGNVANYHVPPEAATMFRDIQKAGYTTAQIGKLHWSSGASLRTEFKSANDYFRALGLDFVLDVSGPVDSPKDNNPYAQYLRNLGLLDAVATDLHDRYVKWEFEPRASILSPEHYHDSFVTRAATDFIRQQPKDKPMCLVVSLHSPHPPLDAPGAFATMFAPANLMLPENVPSSFPREKRSIDQPELRQILANYLGKIALVDFNVGILVESMRDRGSWDNTLVFLTADHGEMMGAHGALTKGRFYEESARVPLLMRWPDHVKAGRTKALAQMFDVYPTIVDAIGGELSPGRFAKSLLPVATGTATSVRDVAISEIGKEAPLHMMARDARFKWWTDEKSEYLFDLENDPLEMHNLANQSEHQESLSHMREQMLTQIRSTQLNLSEGYTSKVQRLRAAK